jgi:hypothetical protein
MNPTCKLYNVFIQRHNQKLLAQCDWLQDKVPHRSFMFLPGRVQRPALSMHFFAAHSHSLQPIVALQHFHKFHFHSLTLTILQPVPTGFLSALYSVHIEVAGTLVPQCSFCSPVHSFSCPRPPRPALFFFC